MEVYQSSRTAAELEYALGAVPSIGANNHWFIGDQDTGIIAIGQSPYMGDNGNWWVGETDTGIFAGGVDVTGAKVGQTIQVAAVDENGRPTEWTAIDFPAGDDYELILHNVVEENSQFLYHDVDDSGNPFELRKALAFIKHIPVLKDDGTYDAGNGDYGASVHFVNPANVNAVIKAEGLSGTCATGWALSHSNVAIKCAKPKAADVGLAFSIVEVENVNGELMINKLYTSTKQDYASTEYNRYAMLNMYGTISPISVKKRTGLNYLNITAEACANENVYLEASKIAAFSIGNLNTCFGVGTEYWLYGVRK